MSKIEQVQKEFGIVGKSKEIKDLIDICIQVAATDISILIYGESGVGKEIFAKTIHGLSKRSGKSLVSVNCGAIPEGILESELFGHKKGSFTGAVEDRKGYFEIADNSTLFLDEIGEMPLTTQVKLLRVLETNEFMRIGSETVTKVDVRIIAASNKDLQNEVDSRRFRKDLFFRLKAVTLNIPPLRARREDVTVLIYHFLREYSNKNNIPEPRLTNRAVDLLVNYSWPGNVRELKNTIESALALNKNGEIDIDFFLPLLSDHDPGDNRNLPIPIYKSSESIDRDMIIGALIEIKKDLIELKQLANKSRSSNYPIGREMNIEEVKPLEQVEKEAILNALNFTRGNKRKAAKLLKISERTLYRKVKEYDIDY